MPDPLTYRLRQASPGVTVLDLVGDLTAASEGPLMSAYHAATIAGARAIVLNFSRLGYMNSSGIGVLVTLLVRTGRQRQRLLACELSDHYRQILELTRLDDAIGVHDSERDALAAIDGVAPAHA